MNVIGKAAMAGLPPLNLKIVYEIDKIAAKKAKILPY